MIAIANGPTLPAAVDVVVYDSEQAWLDGREGKHGSSDAAAILGASTTRGPWDVYAERVLKRRNTIDPKIARRGHREESRILEDYAEATGHTYIGPLRTVSVVGPGPFLDSPDAYLLDGEWGGAELKTDTTRFQWGRSGAVVERWSSDAAAVIREDYATQCYYHLAVNGLPWWRLVVKRSMDDLRWYTFAADAALQDRMLNILGDWWERHIVRGVAPPLDDTETCLRAQARIFGPAERAKTKRPATPDEAALIAEDIRITRELAELGGQQRLIRSQLAQAIGDGYGAEAKGIGKALFIDVQGRESVDVDLLRSRYPEAFRAALRRGDPDRFIRIYPEK